MSVRTVDARGKHCPLPIVSLAKEARQAQKGDELIVLSDDDAFPPDVKSWCQKTGNKLISVEETEGHFRATIRKEG